MAYLPADRIVAFGDDIAPNFDISISGKDAGEGTDLFEAIRPLITSISYEEDEELATSLQITIVNTPDDQLGRPVNWNAIIDSKAFQEGNFIDLWIGYGKQRTYMGRTEIVKWLPSFPSSGPTTFTLKAFDARHRMLKGNQFKMKDKGKKHKRKTFYQNLPDELIVEKVAAKYGFLARIAITEKKQHVTRKTTVGPELKPGQPLPPGVSLKGTSQSVFKPRIQPTDMTDWVFLQKLADINRFDLWVEYSLDEKNWIVYFQPRPDTGSAEYLFEYRTGSCSLLEATPEFSISDQATDVELLYFDTKKQTIERTVISETKSSEDVRLNSATPGDMVAKQTLDVGARVRFSAFGQVVEAFSNRPFSSKGEAETFAKNYLKERERDLMTLKGKIVGLETLRPRQIHQIKGLSTRLDGFYRITKTTHNITPGDIYSCDFTAHKIISQDIIRRPVTTTAKSKLEVTFEEGTLITGTVK